jgi:hypothetical protein
LTDREVQEKANRGMQHAKQVAKQVSKNCIATFRGEFFGDDDLYVMNRQGTSDGAAGRQLDRRFGRE